MHRNGQAARARITLAATLLCGLHALSHATPFNEKLLAPRVMGADELRARARAYFMNFEQTLQAATSISPFIRERALYQQWSELNWCLMRALDEAIPLGDLSEFGLLLRDDGSYVVNLRDFPEWAPIDERLRILRNPHVYQSYVAALKHRGFRPQDLDTLGDYLARHDPEQAAAAEHARLTESFTAAMRRRARAAPQIDREQVVAYLYQKQRSAEEAQRQWAIGLLDALDEERQSILVSYFDELGTTRVYGSSFKPLGEQVNEVLAALNANQSLRRWLEGVPAPERMFQPDRSY